MNATDPGDGEPCVIDGDRRDLPAALVIAGVTAAAVAVLGYLATQSLAAAGVCAASAAAGVTLTAVIIAPR